MKRGQAPDREQVAGLQKGLAIIEAFGAGQQRLTLSEAARLTGTSPAAARRCLRTLQGLGYVTSDGRYFRLAPRVLRLGQAYVASNTLPRTVQPVLESLTEHTHESASVGILDDAEIVFVARSTARRSLSSGVGVGTRLPAYCSATGRVLLAAQPDRQVAQLLARSKPTRLTPRTLVEPARLIQAVRAARELGYAVSDEEIELGLRSIAVPLRDSSGSTVAAMSLAVRTAQMTREQTIERLLPALETARRSLAGLL
ncbi:MAG TPA: IclR family transcriptional regulator C-terminal domain-containing protein [Burkholderiaceae bacterium]|nr:IclR family transcriptional regulator C-terminal domain-containing protein [Burkholderiaceae bacterium]